MLPTKFHFIWPSGFRGEDFFESANQKQELPMEAMFVNGSQQNEQSLERTFQRWFLPSFTSFGWGVSEEKIKMWKVNRRHTTDAKWWQKLTLPLARWAKSTLHSSKTSFNEKFIQMWSIQIAKNKKTTQCFRSNPELKSATFQIQNVFPKIEGLLQSKPRHIFRINYHIALICEYSNMMSFIGYVNNAVIKLPIYFNSHMHIFRQIKASFLYDFVHLYYRTVVHTIIKMFVLFLYIFIFSEKKPWTNYIYWLVYYKLLHSIASDTDTCLLINFTNFEHCACFCC